MTLASSSFTTLFGRKRESFSYTLPMECLVNLYAHYTMDCPLCCRFRKGTTLHSHTHQRRS